MKWKSHTAIARAISTELGLPDELEKALCNGSIDPDRRPDAAFWKGKKGETYIGRAPHHMPPTGTIMAYVWRARKAYLQGNDYWAVKSLGRALHYVQDKSVFTGFLGWSHDPQEKAIAELKPSREAVRRGIDLAVCSPLFVRECIDAVRPRRDPREALYQATVYSSAIFASVIGPADAQEEFVREFGEASGRHRLRYLAAGGAVAVSAAAAFLGAQPLYLLAGASSGYALVRVDPRYHRLKDEAEWFGFRPLTAAGGQQ
jgi:hypothetical protein